MTFYSSRAFAISLRFLTLLGLLAAVGLPGRVQAQAPARRLLGSFLSNGVYFFTNSSGRDAFGSAQFYNETILHGRPKQFANLIQLSGGIEIVSASDRFFPFSGGNQFNLIGPSVRITTRRILGQVRPYFAAGLFLGNVRSDRLGINATDFTPSVSFGAEWPFARYFTVTAGYRFSEQIGGVGTEGFILTLRIF